MKTKMKIIGFYAILAVAIVLELFVCLNWHKDSLTIPLTVAIPFGALFVLNGYYSDVLCQNLDEYRIVKTHDIRDTVETNVRYLVEQKCLDLLRKEESWFGLIYKTTEDKACEVIANLKKGIPLNKSGFEEVINREC